MQFDARGRLIPEWHMVESIRLEVTAKFSIDYDEEASSEIYLELFLRGLTVFWSIIYDKSVIKIHIQETWQAVRMYAYYLQILYKNQY